MCRRVVPLLVLIAALAAAGCGARPGAQRSDRPVAAVATTTQVADLVRHLGGARVDVTQMLQPGSDPHGYEPRPSDARAIERADVVFRSGGDVDAWIADLVSAGRADARRVDLIDSVHTRDEDPHWWQDPRNAERAVAAIRRALTRADPAGAEGYAARARAYSRRLRALDRRVARCIDRLPADRRKLVTSHDALGYYTARYGLKLVGTVIPSLSTQAQPSSRAVNRLVDQIRRERVKAIFPDSQLSPKIEKAVARESGARVGGTLWADALGPQGSEGATYIGSIQANTDTIVRGLSGGSYGCPA